MVTNYFDRVEMPVWKKINQSRDTFKRSIAGRVELMEKGELVSFDFFGSIFGNVLVAIFCMRFHNE